MEYGLLAIVPILTFIIVVIFIDKRREIELTKIKPSHPYMPFPDERIRIRLARQVTRILDLWDLSESDQAILLGIHPAHNGLLKGYRNGKAVECEMDRLGRVGHLLTIHDMLRGAFPKDKAKAYRWVSQRNRKFGNQRPLDIMKEGYEGLITVRRYLHFIS